jgi:hypothetical protein
LSPFRWKGPSDETRRHPFGLSDAAFTIGPRQTMSKVIARPELTMPKSESKVLQLAYSEADVILEYGSGGSTVAAAELPGKTVFSVESDAKWLKMMTRYFAQNPPLANLTLHRADIGPTKSWSLPSDEKMFRDWPKYPLGVWDLPDFVHPDVVLIDGRFRVGCFLSTLFKITRPTVVLWDDYLGRRRYHEVEDLIKPTEFVGRMAVFNLSPMTVPADRLLWIVQAFLRAH